MTAFIGARDELHPAVDPPIALLAQAVAVEADAVGAAVARAAHPHGAIGPTPIRITHAIPQSACPVARAIVEALEEDFRAVGAAVARLALALVEVAHPVVAAVVLTRGDERAVGARESGVAYARAVVAPTTLDTIIIAAVIRAWQLLVTPHPRPSRRTEAL